MTRTILLATALAAPLWGATVYTDTTFANANWQTVVLQQSATANFSVTQALANFNFYALAAASFAQGPIGTARDLNIARFRPGFTWDPSFDGPLSSLEFSMDIRHEASNGFSLPEYFFWRPVILQGGLTYSVSTSSLKTTGTGVFNTFTWSFTNQSDWVNFENPALSPDFSASGSVIQFGYRFQRNGACNNNSNLPCSAASVFESIDNYRVQLGTAEPSSAVPEPSTWALTAALRCRSTSGTRKDAA